MCDDIPLKRCPDCEKEFPATAEFFHRDKSAKDGLSFYCKPCAIAKAKKYYHNPENQERVRISGKVFRDQNKERLKAKQKAYQSRPEVRDHIISYHRDYYQKNKEELLAKDKARREERIKAIPDKLASRRMQEYIQEQIILPQEPQQGRLHYVYALKYPKDYSDAQKAGTTFYIGKGLGDRINKHEREAWTEPDALEKWRVGKNPHKRRVIRRIWSEDKRIVKEIFAFFETHEEALQYEIALIFLMDNLTNVTDGGDGVVGLRHSEETRRKLGEMQKGVRTGIRLSPEHSRRISEGKKRAFKERPYPKARGRAPWKKHSKYQLQFPEMTKSFGE